MLINNINNFSIRTSKGLISIEQPLVMGIINLSKDSFFDGGHITNIDECFRKIDKHLQEGAKIIDIGATSSKPNSEIVDTKSELLVLEKYIPSIISRFGDTIFSIDTYNSASALYALENGIDIINDISGYEIDKSLFEVIKKHKCPYILMHMKGDPSNMHKFCNYDNIINEMIYFFSKKISELHSIGVVDIIVDVGFGFSKTIEDNYRLLKKLNIFSILNKPLMVGISRKSMLYKPLGSSANEVLPYSVALHFEALRNGAKLLRVHDVKEAIDIIKLYNIYSNI